MVHPIDPTTHTIEMRQIDELNARLRQPGTPPISAADLGLENPPPGGAHQDPGLPGRARLVEVTWTGTPSFPNIAGTFASEGFDAASMRLLLHTAHLRALSRRLGLRHAWGL